VVLDDLVGDVHCIIEAMIGRGGPVALQQPQLLGVPEVRPRAGLLLVLVLLLLVFRRHCQGCFCVHIGVDVAVLSSTSSALHKQFKYQAAAYQFTTSQSFAGHSTQPAHQCGVTPTPPSSQAVLLHCIFFCDPALVNLQP
jgi:hypothetical protein